MSSGQWWDETWNPWRGCLPVSEGCELCYAARQATRFWRSLVDDRPSGGVRFNGRSDLGDLAQPIHWRRPRQVFLCSMSDFFFSVPWSWRHGAWDVMRATLQHRYLILTKRPQNIERMLPRDWDEGWFHVWPGITGETQARYNERWEILTTVPCAGRFVCIEPMLGPVTLFSEITTGRALLPDWVIAGGETGPGARPCKREWIEKLRRECRSAQIPFWLKSWGKNSDAAGVEIGPEDRKRPRELEL